MAPRTVQQVFGLKDPELNALATLAGLEGYRGGKGEDVAAVAANILSRRLSGKWGGIDIRNIAKSPDQYEAVFDYSMPQLADPAFGAQKLGGQQEFERVKAIVNNLQQVGEQYRRSGGAQSFRGTAAYESKKPTDYMPVPGKSNFYFDPLPKDTYQKGAQLFSQATASSPPPPVLPAQQAKQGVPNKTSDYIKQMLMFDAIRQTQQSNPVNALLGNLLRSTGATTKSFVQEFNPVNVLSLFQ